MKNDKPNIERTAGTGEANAVKAFSVKVLLAAKKDAVLSIAFVAALASTLLCKPSAQQLLRAIDFRVLILLFCLMAVIQAFKAENVLDTLALLLLRKCHSVRSVYLALCALVFFSAAVVTNDVALLTFVPITLIVCQRAGLAPLRLVVLETLAANLGSCVTPMGNPQNLYLFSFYAMDAPSFFGAMAKIGAVSLVMIAALICFVTRTPKGAARQRLKPQLGALPRKSGARTLVYALLLAVILLSVFHVLPAPISLAATIALIGACNFRLFAKVDYSLLLTFVFFFVFTGNLSAVPAVAEFFSAALEGGAATYFAGLGLSQIISNVPAALLLSGFSQNNTALLAGVNIGGLGTLIASLASVISYKLYQAAAIPAETKQPFLGVFTLYNLIFLAVLVPVGIFV